MVQFAKCVNFTGVPNVVVAHACMDDSVEEAVVAAVRSGSESDSSPVSFVNHVVNPPTVDCGGRSGDQSLNGEGTSGSK